MKTSLCILLFAVSLPAAAQTADAIYQQACGPLKAAFTVEQVKAKPPAAPDPGKALVYIIQDQDGAPFTTRIGLDGAWVGVIQGRSYIFLSIAPGEHHGCAATLNRKHREAEFLDFTVEAGKTYDLLIRGIGAQGKYVSLTAMLFGPVDHDEAAWLIASDPQSVAKPKP